MSNKLPESGTTRTPWLEVKRPDYPILDRSLECDVLVIGAGIAGLTCAYLLAKEGKAVVVLDSGRIISGETQRTTAHLSDQMDDFYIETEKIFGVANSRVIRESLTASIDKIEEIVKAENIDCDFERVPAYLFAARDTPADLLKNEREAGLRAGIRQIDYLAECDAIPSRPQALRYHRQAQIHVVKYLKGICKALHKMDVQIFQGSGVTRVDNKGQHKDRPQGILYNDQTVTAGSIIVATNGPIIDFAIQTRQIAYRTFAIALKVPPDSIQKALYWDTHEPYHYVRLQRIDDDPANELLIVGGENHRVGEFDDAPKRFAALKEWAIDTFNLSPEVICNYEWSGQVYEPTDLLGFIGLDPDMGSNVYVATGDSGMGINNGTIAGILLTDLIMGRDNPWTNIYSPGRIKPAALTDYVIENARSLSHYAANILPSKIKAQSQIPNGHGAILDEGVHKLAAYKDDGGNVSRMSAYCTHLNGVVCWNSCEKSWDCPVHGSRFTAEGQRIYGPADGDLKVAK